MVVTLEGSEAWGGGGGGRLFSTGRSRAEGNARGQIC